MFSKSGCAGLYFSLLLFSVTRCGGRRNHEEKTQLGVSKLAEDDAPLWGEGKRRRMRCDDKGTPVVRREYAKPKDLCLAIEEVAGLPNRER